MNCQSVRPYLFLRETGTFSDKVDHQLFSLPGMASPMRAIPLSRLRIRRCLAVSERRLVSLFFLTILTSLSSLVDAQLRDGAAVNRQDLNRIAIQHLSAGDTVKALKSLEAAGYATTPISMAQPDRLAPACAGLHRALSQLSSEEQFELLRTWSIPVGANRI